MTKQIYVNIPVKDLAKSTEFYEKLGFTKNPMFSDENASGMVWTDTIYVMLLTHDFYKRFIGDKEIVDASKTSGALFALGMETKEDVQKFADTAKENGGNFYHVEMGIDPNMMFSIEVEDLDGHTWEPIWTSSDFEPHDS